LDTLAADHGQVTAAPGPGEPAATARRRHGLETIADIKYAILEASGEISIIPRRGIGEDARAAGAQ